MLLSLCLSEHCIRFLLGSISKLEFSASCIITTLLFALLSSRGSRFKDFTIGVTLVSGEYSLVMKFAALF